MLAVAAVLLWQEWQIGQGVIRQNAGSDTVCDIVAHDISDYLPLAQRSTALGAARQVMFQRGSGIFWQMSRDIVRQLLLPFLMHRCAPAVPAAPATASWPGANDS